MKFRKKVSSATALVVFLLLLLLLKSLIGGLIMGRDNNLCKKDATAPEEWRMQCRSSVLLDFSTDSTKTSTTLLHFVTTFVRGATTHADLVRTAQTLTQVKDSNRIHWLLVELVGTEETSPECLLAGVSDFMDQLGLDYTYLVQGVSARTGCLSASSSYQLGTQVALDFLLQQEAGGTVHFTRLEVAYPLTFFEEVVAKSERQVLSFPVVSLVEEETHIFAPIISDSTGKVTGFVGDMGSPFALLSMALRMDFLTAKGGRPSSLGMGRINLSDIAALDAERSVVFHVRTRPFEVEESVRPPPEYSGPRYNLDGLVASMVDAGFVKEAVDGGDASPMETCAVGECQNKY